VAFCPLPSTENEEEEEELKVAFREADTPVFEYQSPEKCESGYFGEPRVSDHQSLDLQTLCLGKRDYSSALLQEDSSRFLSCSEDREAVRFGFKKRTIKLLDKNRVGPGIHQKTLRVEENKSRDASAVKKKLTMPVSPRLHLKDRALNREADLNKTMH
jgi:hypothetical protein